MVFMVFGRLKYTGWLLGTLGIAYYQPQITEVCMVPMCVLQEVCSVVCFVLFCFCFVCFVLFCLVLFCFVLFLFCFVLFVFVSLSVCLVGWFSDPCCPVSPKSSNTCLAPKAHGWTPEEHPMTGICG